MSQLRDLDLPLLLKAIQPYKHLMYEPVTQRDLDGLYQLYDTWVITLGDSPEAVALCNALNSLVEACVAGLPVDERYAELAALLQDVEKPYSVAMRQAGYRGALR